MTSEPVAEELAQRLSLLIGMIMEDEVDASLSAATGGAKQLLARLALLRRAGEDIETLAAAAEVTIRRYGRERGLSAITTD